MSDVAAKQTPEDAISRIALIDSFFEGAVGWGSWMVSCANEREELVDFLARHGIKVEHRYQARTQDGGRTD